MPRRKITVRRQTPVKGGRIYHSAGFVNAVEIAINREIDRVQRTHGWRVSRSFVIANCVGFSLNVKSIESYEEEPEVKRGR